MAYSTYTDVYAVTGLSNSEVASATVTTLISYADAEIDSISGRKFSDANSTTEYIDGPKKDIFDNKATSINLSNYPIQSISTLNILNTDGTTSTTYGTLTSAQIAAGTYSTTDYWLDLMEDQTTGSTIPYGKITLKTDVFPVGIANVKVTYTYGYSSVPTIVKNLSVCLAGIRTWVNFLGGSYNYLNSYSIPQQAVNKGDFYDRGMKNIALLTEEAEKLWLRIGKRRIRTFFGSGASR